MGEELSQAQVKNLIGVNQLLYTRTSPTNPVTERTQKKSYAENGSNASLTQNDHLIVNLQTGTEYIDTLQGFLCFDLEVEKTAAVAGDINLYMPGGGACNLMRDVQISARSGKELDRLNQANLLNYHMIFHEQKEFSRNNLEGLMCAETRYLPTVGQLDNDKGRTSFKFVAAGPVGSVETKSIRIPMKYVAPIFNSQKLMPPHLARGLRIDITLEDKLLAFCAGDADILATPGSFKYTVRRPYILSDSYRMADSVSRYINENFASQKSGLVYEYFSYSNTKTTSSTSDLNVEVRSAVSMAIDAFMVTRSSDAPLFTVDSFASLPVNEADRSQWRVGSHHLPSTPIVGIVDHYAQTLYWEDKLRDDVPDGINYRGFEGNASAAGIVGDGLGKFPCVMSRNNILSLSGVAINNSLTLAIDATLAAGGDRRVTVFMRHLRRAILFLESVVLET